MIEHRLDTEIAEKRVKTLYGAVKDALEGAKEAYQNGNAQKMDAMIKLADVQANLLIAEHIAMLTKVIDNATSKRL